MSNSVHSVSQCLVHSDNLKTEKKKKPYVHVLSTSVDSFEPSLLLAAGGGGGGWKHVWFCVHRQMPSAVLSLGQ